MIVVINILHGITTLFLVYLFNHSKDMHGLLEIMPYSTYIEIYGIYAVTILFVITNITLIFGLIKKSSAIMKPGATLPLLYNQHGTDRVPSTEQTY